MFIFDLGVFPMTDPMVTRLRALCAVPVAAVHAFVLAAVFLFVFMVSPPSARAAEPVLIGLDADMSSAASESGIAIKRGIEVAIEEINAAGGVLGRPLKLVVRDHRGNPARGKDNIEEFADMRNLVAVVGGIHTPVAMAELDMIHKNKILYLGAWAAGTPVVDNGFDPNYVFRVSVRDQYAARFLLEAALKRGYKKPGLLLERTGWGRSSEKAFIEAAVGRGADIAGVQWLNWGAKDLNPQIGALAQAGADVIMLVTNPSEGVIAVKNIAAKPAEKRLPIISHWGITGGAFVKRVGSDIADINLSFLQTVSFMDPPRPEKAAAFLDRYFKMYPDVKTAEDIRSPVGTAHAYDLVHMLARAIAKAGTIDRSAVRDAMENLGRYDGLVRAYDPPFTAARHDALDVTDFSLARFRPDGAIVPTQ